MKIKELFKSLGIVLLYFLIPSVFGLIFYAFTKNEEISSIIGYIFTTIIFIFIFKKDLINDFKSFSFNKTIDYIPLFIALIAISSIANIIISNLIGNIAQNEANVDAALNAYPFIYSIYVGILGPFLEELVFRLNFKNVFKSKKVFNIFTALLFSSIHILASNSLIEVLFIIPYFILGYGLSYIYSDSKNFYSSFLVHAFNNIYQLVLLFL